MISEDLALPVAEFTTFLATTGDLTKKLGANNAAIIFSDPGAEEKGYFIGLKRVESLLVPGTLKCFFLQEWRRQEAIVARGDHPGATIAGRCGIYHSRPQMCRTYPTVLHENGAVGFIATPPPVPLSGEHQIYRICPEEWTPQAFGHDPSKTLHTLVLNRYETDFQNRAIAEWNSSPGLAKDFFPYMQRAYGSRFRMAQQSVTIPPESTNA